MDNIKLERGFTMVEMAVSMAIIGLIVASVLTGANVKRKLELSGLIDDISAISVAVQEFEATYGALPGDMYNAEAIFGAANTDDGNGDGDLGTSEGTDTNTNETLLFWQHLQLAGLIEGAYDGATDGVGGKMESSIPYGIYTVAADATGQMSITADKEHATIRGLLYTKEAYDILLKYDNGSPVTGVILVDEATGATAGNCVTGGNEINLAYTTDKPCQITFIIKEGS